jgi:hypothetical protein
VKSRRASNQAKSVAKLNKSTPLLHIAFWLTVPVNASGAVIFSVPAFREFIGLPAPAHGFYGILVGVWIGLFGLAFLRLALTKTYDKSLIAVAALGKLSFFALAVFYFLRGEIGLLATLASVIDAGLAFIFLHWLWLNRAKRS